MISNIRSDAGSTELFDYLPYFRLGFSSQLLMVIAFTLCLIISGMMTSVSPLLTSALVDNISKKTSYDTIMIGSAQIGFAALIDIVVSYLSTLLSMRITTVAAFSIVRSKIDELVRMPFELYFEQESAEKTQQICSDANTVASFGLSMLQTVLLAVVQLGISFIFLYGCSVALFWVSVTFCILYAIAYALFKKPLFVSGLTFKEEQSLYFGKVESVLAHQRFLYVNVLFERALKSIDSFFSSLLHAGVTYQSVVSRFQATDSFAAAASQVTILLISAFYVVHGSMSVGQLVAVSSYMALMLSAVRSIYGIGSSVQDCFSSISRLNASKMPLVAAGEELMEIDCIELRNFGFTLNGKCLYSNLNIRFEKGKLYALVGINGSGKTTLAYLLMGCFNSDYVGTISYNGKAQEEINCELLRQKLVSFAEQTPISVKDFLCDRNFPSIERKRCGGMSPGELEQLEIRRVLEKKADVYLFDEPTASLDSAHKEALIKAMKEMRKHKIVIAITHDMDLIAASDEVVELGKSD